MNSGWVKTYRKLSEWEWYKDSSMVHLFIHLLIKANHEDKNWRGKVIKRGQLVTSRKIISSQTGISEQTIRTCLERLKSTSEITIQSTNRNSVITICNYETYQVEKNETNQQTNQPARRQSTSNQPTIKQELEEVKNIYIEKLKKKEIEFKKTIEPFIEKYGRDLCNEFYLYWTEPNKSKTKLRFEMQKTWDISRRLATWAKNDKKFNNGRKQQAGDNESLAKGVAAGIARAKYERDKHLQ